MIERRRFSVVTANIWRDNKQAAEDLRTLTRSACELIGINEGGNWTLAIKHAASIGGYVAHGVTGSRIERQNPVLVRSDLPATGDVKRLSRAVGEAPERTMVTVLTEIGNAPVAFINTHGNAGVQAGPAKPKALPRVREYVAGQKALEAEVRQLRAAGYRVIVAGDLNWAWAILPRQWTWSPQSVFKRLGMTTQHDAQKLPRPKGDRRAIEYIAWDRDGFEAVKGSRRFIGPERSDHPFDAIDLEVKP